MENGTKSLRTLGRSLMSFGLLFLLLLSLAVIAIPAIRPAHAETVVATIPVGQEPWDIAANPSTNMVYVTNQEDNTVSVINGSTDTVSKTIPVGSHPLGIAVNPDTNMIYATNYLDNTVSVIDGATNTVTSVIPVGGYPQGIAVNPVTDRIYVAGSDNVSVIDGTTNGVIDTVPGGAGLSPTDVGVNTATNEIYVTNWGSDLVTVISGATNTVLATIPTLNAPDGIGVNSATDEIYVTHGGFRLTVIDGATNTVKTTIPMPGPGGVAVDTKTDLIYAASYFSNSTATINGSTDSVIDYTAVGQNPQGMTVNPNTDEIYTANFGSNTVSVIAGSTVPTTTSSQTTTTTVTSPTTTLTSSNNSTVTGTTTTITNTTTTTTTITSSSISTSSESTTTTAGASVLTIGTQDTNGKAISGYDVILYSSNGQEMATGFSPVQFQVSDNQQYTVLVDDYGNYTFAHWLDSGSVDRYRTIASNGNLSLIAVYENTGVPPPSGYTRITVVTQNTVGSMINGYYTTFWQGGTLLHECYSTCSFFVLSGQTYQVTVADYRSEMFSHWQNGNTARFYTVIVPDSTTTSTLTATYTP
jgi:YVTN family beta-propeller protein